MGYFCPTFNGKTRARIIFLDPILTPNLTFESLLKVRHPYFPSSYMIIYSQNTITSFHLKLWDPRSKGPTIISSQHPHSWTKTRQKLKYTSKNWSKIANICRNWTKLGRNPVELIVPETLGGVPKPNLNQRVSKKQKNNKKNKLRTLTPWE